MLLEASLLPFTRKVWSSVTTIRAWKVVAMTLVGCVAIFASGAVAEETLQSDVAVLRAVARANPTFNQSDWKRPWVGDDPCYWKGITCTGSRVTWIVLQESNLSGPIPADLSGLTALFQLRLQSNQLSGPIPKELSALSSLGELDLSDNQLRGPIPKELLKLRETRILLGCIKTLSFKDLNMVCTTKGKEPYFFIFHECPTNCLPAHPKRLAAIVWSVWLGIAVVVAIVVLLVSPQFRLPAGHVPTVTPIGICLYAWGLFSLALLLLDVITNIKTLNSLSGWSLYVVAFLIVGQHLVSGLMLYAKCVRQNSWPFVSGLSMRTEWDWAWQRSIIGFKENGNLEGDAEGIQKMRILHVFLWPLGLVYVIMLDILSLLSLKLGFQIKFGTKWVNLKPYWASRELTDALFQALPQAVFLTVLLAGRVNTTVTHIYISEKLFVLSVSSSLASVISVLAMVLWEAQTEPPTERAGKEPPTDGAKTEPPTEGAETEPPTEGANFWKRLKQTFLDILPRGGADYDHNDRPLSTAVEV